jgi:hypothetical protein
VVLSGSRICALVLGLAACGADPPLRDPVPLVDHRSWSIAEDGADLYAEHRPAEDCSPVRFGPEVLSGQDVVEVVSGGCLYVTLAQPSLHDVLEGEVIHLRLWHYPLIGTEPGTAHIGLAFGDREVYRAERPIPTEEALLETYWRASFAVTASTTIQFHVHNHGFNAYDLIDLTVGGTLPERN